MTSLALLTVPSVKTLNFGKTGLRNTLSVFTRNNYFSSLINFLNSLQYKIAFRGAQLLKIGGRLVYSTCSLYPLEDEAVVAQILRKSRGALRLVDVSQEIPGLKRNPGITRWQVMDRDMQWYETCPENKAHKLPLSLWPPTESEIAEFHLERTYAL